VLRVVGVAEGARDPQPAPAGRPAPAGCGPLLSAMGYEPIDLDSICAASGLTADVASAMLLALELDGTVSRLPGGLYQRLR
jgi:DNA processing protein